MLWPACSSESIRAACAARSRVGLHAVDGERGEVAGSRAPRRGRPRQAAGSRTEEARGNRSPRSRGRTGRRGARGGAAARRCAASRAPRDGRPAARSPRLAPARRSARPRSPPCAPALAAHTRASRASSRSMTRQHWTARASTSVRAIRASATRGSSSRATARLTRRRASLPGRANPIALGGAASRRLLPPSPPSRNRSRSPGRNRRCPLGVRRQGTTPASAQRRRVCSLTSSISAAAATRSQRRRPPGRRALSLTPYGHCRPIGLVSVPTLSAWGARMVRRGRDRGYAVDSHDILKEREMESVRS